MLKGMVALVTGGAGCLGLATTKKLVSEGSKVVMMDLPVSKGKELAEEIGENAVFSAGDITSEEDVSRTFDLTKSKFGHLNLIVNCAGITRGKTLYNFNKDTTCDMEDVRKVIDVSLVGTINVIRLGLRELVKNTPDPDGQRGLLINTSGFAAFDGQTGQVLNSAIWGGICSMTQPLCREMGPFGVRVVTIAPGLMQSKLTDIFPSKVSEHLTAVVPTPKRFGLPEEYAHLVMSIIGNPYLNGEVIRLDGGLRFYLY